MMQTIDAAGSPHLRELALALRDIVVHARRNSPDGPTDRAAAGLLLHLLTLGPVRAGDLAERARLDPSTVSRHLQSLEDDGYVRRSDDPEDGRATVVEVSAQGRQLVTKVLDHRIGALGRAVSDWSAADVSSLTHLLRRLADDLARS
jgi:DNA-binding MarR family transcriptional regulator